MGAWPTPGTGVARRKSTSRSVREAPLVSIGPVAGHATFERLVAAPLGRISQPIELLGNFLQIVADIREPGLRRRHPQTSRPVAVVWGS